MNFEIYKASIAVTLQNYYNAIKRRADQETIDRLWRKHFNAIEKAMEIANATP